MEKTTNTLSATMKEAYQYAQDFINEIDLYKLQEQRKEFYESKIEAKKEKLQELIEKKDKLSSDLLDKAKEMTSRIPFGQPIHVGHYSEKADRNYRNKINTTYQRAFKECDKKVYFQEKLNNLENDNVIRSDDPEALNKYKVKLERLESKREEIKTYNKDCKKTLQNKIPQYVLTNLGQNIKSIELKIKELEALQNTEFEDKIYYTKDFAVNVIYNKIQNRIQFEFDCIPSEEIRTYLKSNGFKWSPFNKMWQRQLNINGINAKNRFLQHIKNSN